MGGDKDLVALRVVVDELNADVAAGVMRTTARGTRARSSLALCL